MARLPKKVSNDIQSNVDIRTFVSSAAKKPMSASSVIRINMTITDEDSQKVSGYQDEYGATRADVFSVALVALDRISSAEVKALFDEIRKSRPKAGRPPNNK